uniref:Uncharacterized protein n=1 Tax=Daphnia galeata TaxID=27404 RepID=A0A8J2RFB1_9CRUS|nr:unnamed protein product [Daphnia galeata]
MRFSKCVSITAHHIIQNNFTLYYKLIEQYLIPIIKISMKSYPHQQIIWLRLHTSVDQFYRGSFYNEIIDTYNNAISLTLKYERSDNNYVIIENGIDHGYLNCNDFIHPGMRAISMGTQLIFNRICQIPKDLKLPFKSRYSTH